MDEKQSVGENEEKVFVVGAEIQMGNNRMGIIRYKGPVHDAPGEWFGVELIAPSSNKSGNNGVMFSKRYFFAPNGRAVFIQKKQIKKVLNKNTNSQINNVVDQAKRIEALSPNEWNTNDVCRWLAKIEALEAVTIFLVHGVTGNQLLKLLPDDLRYKLGIKDKNLITKIIKAKERLEAQFTILPNVREGAPLTLDEFKDPDNDMIRAPVFRVGERGRSKSWILMNNASKKRDSYSIPEKWRGKLPSPRDSNKSSKHQFPPQRGSFRLDQGDRLRKPRSLPITERVHLGNLAEKETYTINLGSDLDAVSSEEPGHHSRSSSLTDIIESKPMKEWETKSVVRWINSLGGKASTYDALFRDRELRGNAVVKLTVDNLKALGVAEPGVRKWIISSRDDLLERQKSILDDNEV